MSIEYPCVYWSDGMCKNFSDDKSTSWCVEGPCGDQIPSNADRIRAMSDEELAVFLSRGLKEPCNCCQLAVFEGACTETLCDDAMMKWLRRPVEGE